MFRVPVYLNRKRIAHVIGQAAMKTLLAVTSHELKNVWYETNILSVSVGL